MAGLLDFFTPGSTDNLMGLDPRALQAAAQQWQQFIGDPASRAGLLGTGIAMTQPMAWGDTGLSHATRAIGAGGESVARSEAEMRKTEESEAKIGLNEARSEASRARAGEVGALTELKRGRLDLDEQRHQDRVTDRERRAQFKEREFEGKMDIQRQRIAQAATTEERNAAQLELRRLQVEAGIEAEKIRSGQADERLDLGRLQGRITLQKQFKEVEKAAKDRHLKIDQDILSYKNKAEKDAAKARDPIPEWNSWVDANEERRSILRGYRGVDPSTPAPTVPPAPPAPSVPTAQLRKDPAEVARARKAIEGGKDRGAVRDRLIANGIDPEGL